MTLVIGLMIFLLTVVMPQFAVLYDQMGSKLPAMTTRPAHLRQVDAPQHPLAAS